MNNDRDHRGNRGGSAPEYLRQAFDGYVGLSVQGKVPLVMTVNGQRMSARRLVGKLWTCTDVLPDLRCDQLGIPHGSSCARAARELMPIPNVCIDCEREIYKTATRCRACRALAQWADPQGRATMMRALGSDEFRERQAQMLKQIREERPELREEKAKVMREMWQEPAYRRSRLAAMKELWRDEDYRRKRLAYDRSPEQRRQRSERAKARWDDEHRLRMSEQTKALWRDPTFRAKQATAREQALQDPEYHRKLSEAAKRREAQRRAQREAREE